MRTGSVERLMEEIATRATAVETPTQPPARSLVYDRYSPSLRHRVYRSSQIPETVLQAARGRRTSLHDRLHPQPTQELLEFIKTA